MIYILIPIAEEIVSRHTKNEPFLIVEVGDINITEYQNLKCSLYNIYNVLYISLILPLIPIYSSPHIYFNNYHASLIMWKG
jgi:hypothetical protein